MFRFLKWLVALTLIFAVAIWFGLGQYRKNLISYVPFWNSENPTSVSQLIGETQSLLRLKEVFLPLAKVEGPECLVWTDQSQSTKLSEFSEAFVGHIRSMFPSKASKKTKLFILSQSQYNVVYSDLLGLTSGYDWGWFSEKEALIILNQSRGIGMLGRYLGVQVYDDYVKQGGVRLPLWFESGFYTYLEKFAAYKDESNRTRIMLGYLNPSRFKWVLENQNRALADFLNNPNLDGGTSVLGAFVTFLAREGWLQSFIQVFREDPSDFVKSLEKATRLKISDLEKRFKKWTGSISKSDIDFLQGSLILNRVEYEQWKQSNSEKTKWNDKIQSLIPL